MVTKLHHILETQQFKEDALLQELFALTDEMPLFDIIKLKNRGPTPEEAERCKQLRLPQEPRKLILGNLFYEPSTRTMMSFSSAMMSLEGNAINLFDVERFSSAAKGENIEDTARVAGDYADAIVIRHKEEGAAKKAARHSSVPIINAGDGTGQHPTQTLLDLYTIRQKLGRIDDLKVGMLGDLLNGRTVHSLTYLLAHREGIKLYFISPPELAMRPDIIQYLSEKGIPFEQVVGEELRDVARNLDVLYVTRVQKERFLKPDGSPDEKAYEAVKGSYVVDGSVIDVMGLNSIVMHPLPRVDEIDREIDSDPRAVYFVQSRNGKYVRMALLKMILDGE